jgi:hypothetical protein
MGEFLLVGLRAHNLLAYMAALGTLRTAALHWDTSVVHMEWFVQGGNYHPRLVVEAELDRNQFLSGLFKQLASSKQVSALSLADDLTIPVGEYRHSLRDEQKRTSLEDRRNVDFLASFGSEVIESTVGGKPTGQIADTAFRTMSGAGHQHFLGTIRTLITDTTEQHLEKSLFQDWWYDDPLEKHSMRWDPMDDIRYALRWDKPSGDTARKTSGSMWGANRLAVEALPLHPVQPTGSRLETTAVLEKKGQPAQVTWPVWNGLLGLDEVRSVLALPQLQDERPDRRWLGACGIVEIFRCQRITQGKYRNFTPAWPA